MMKDGYLKILRTASCVMVLLAASVLFLSGCKSDDAGTYTVSVVTEGGKMLEDIRVRIYTDSSKEQQVAMGITDELGRISFESEGAMGCVIALQDVPEGYQVANTYEIKEKDTEIVLKAELLSADNLSEMTFELGDVFADLSVTATDGNTYTISELLKEKKAVVLNFWYLNCNPCKMEFPFLQEAYEEYQDEIEVIALNPVDGTNSTIAEYQEELKLTFPMAACDAQWEQAMQLSAYPTTVVIDRYGTVAFIHKGSVTEAETFKDIFAYFIAEDYKQTTVRNLEALYK